MERSVSSSLLTSCIRSILSPNTLSTQLRKGFPFMSLLRIEAYVSVILMGGKTSGCRDRVGERVVEGKHSSGDLDKVSPAPGRTPPDHPSHVQLEELPTHFLGRRGVLCSALPFNPALVGKFWICKVLLAATLPDEKRCSPQWNTVPLTGNHVHACLRQSDQPAHRQKSCNAPGVHMYSEKTTDRFTPTQLAPS